MVKAQVHTDVKDFIKHFEMAFKVAEIDVQVHYGKYLEWCLGESYEAYLKSKRETLAENTQETWSVVKDWFLEFKDTPAQQIRSINALTMLAWKPMESSEAFGQRFKELLEKHSAEKFSVEQVLAVLAMKDAPRNWVRKFEELMEKAIVEGQQSRDDMIQVFSKMELQGDSSNKKRREHGSAQPVYIHTQTNLNAMLSKWFDTLLDYNFDVVHLPGLDNILPDALSRLFPTAKDLGEQNGNDQLKIDYAVTTEQKKHARATRNTDRFVILRPIEDKTAESVVKAIIPVFCDFGIPTIVQSDNGKEFVNQIMTRFKLKAGFDHRLITPYHPQGNGAAERTVGTSMKLIKKLVEGVSENWDLVVATAQLAINSKVSKRHNATPFSVMFGRKLNDFKNYNEVSYQAS
ncbi:hypothetical protein [Absidia glauca]|uniref:Integrase catalytic domain-containing protein n=1 Tax=Absidia glauca TaxID=4829 RepID=A0A163K138_ABSGL|nr:hypothetical protein [Absidia glauca]